ncbi:hypothetical protein PIROE2DRAFT_13882 [Piromyces sp. E2]|nr:hypothetical protein PIROE2DRAFT_13882 [Piromyces sp. E2]|eukprot:OUM60375.1 hypothetical protein PIROE2DRAFT_13882 [Piromyces sp. E2]
MEFNDCYRRTPYNFLNSIILIYLRDNFTRLKITVGRGTKGEIVLLSNSYFSQSDYTSSPPSEMVVDLRTGLYDVIIIGFVLAKVFAKTLCQQLGIEVLKLNSKIIF